MLRSKSAMPIFWAGIFFFVLNSAVSAQAQSSSAPGHQFSVGQPKSEAELPPGQLRKSLGQLPPKARGKALGWLQSFSFPVEDVETLRVDAGGGVLYADTLVPDAADLSTLIAPSSPAFAADPEKVFKLHSNPGSDNVMFLDFDGHVIEGTAWNYYSEDVLVALPFDPSNNDDPPTIARFTQDELNRIAEIWHRISEDFAAFDLDVTTEEPEFFTDTTGRILITHDTDAAGFDMPLKNSGGVAYVNAFGKSYYAYYSPALVYYTNLYTNLHGFPTLVAEAASHEFGHNLGLSHDGVIDGASYYAGHGDGMVDWGPIMGNSYSRNVTQWSRGEYEDANNPEDDREIIANQLGFTPDDHGDSPLLATALHADENGVILASGPDQDPDNVLAENKGVINDQDDIDWFYLDVTGFGSLELFARPSWHAFSRDDLRGSNLDIELSLYDSNFNLLEVDEPQHETFGNVSSSVSPGRHYLSIRGVGNHSTSDYSDYDSTGMYFIEGTSPTGSIPPDSDPPSPEVMAWQSAPQAQGQSSIVMIAATATDPSGTVEYSFVCVAGGLGCQDSGWQSSPIHSADNLQPGTYYAYKVTARDGYGNQNISSAIKGATTDAESPPPDPDPASNQPPTASASYEPDSALIKKGKFANVTLDGSGSSDVDGEVVAWLWKDSGGNTIGSGPSCEVRLKEGLFEFELTVTDDDGESDHSSVTVSVVKSSDGKGKP